MQFMWSLYRKAADLDGRPKQRRMFGSNTVRLIRATNTGKHFHSSNNGKLSLTFYISANNILYPLFSTYFYCLCYYHFYSIVAVALH